MPVVAAVLIEPEGEPKKVAARHAAARHADPPRHPHHHRPGPAGAGPYVICFTNGCMADYEASAESIGRLKKGQQLAVQAINCERPAGQPDAAAQRFRQGL